MLTKNGYFSKNEKPSNKKTQKPSNPEQEKDGGGDENHEDFGHAVDTHGCFHVGCGEGTGIGAYIGFVEQLTEIIVGTAETTVEDARGAKKEEPEQGDDELL